MKGDTQQAVHTEGLERLLQCIRFVPSPWLTLEEGAHYAHMREGEFSKKVRAGEMPSYKRGRVTLVHTEDIDAWIRTHPSGAAPMAIAARSRQVVA